NRYILIALLVCPLAIGVGLKTSRFWPLGETSPELAGSFASKFTAGTRESFNSQKSIDLLSICRHEPLIWIDPAPIVVDKEVVRIDGVVKLSVPRTEIHYVDESRRDNINLVRMAVLSDY